jgi:hypothetical protein
MAQAGRPQRATRRMRIAGWVPKATETYSEYVILITLSLQQWLHELASLYVQCLSCSVFCGAEHSSYSEQDGHSIGHVCAHRHC